MAKGRGYSGALVPGYGQMLGRQLYCRPQSDGKKGGSATATPTFAPAMVST